ncbi:hypothetical protein [Streptomyces asoensis]|uniref:Uncharacterized protein n=1 Tax=Streptomyces asoensis TaxID=249586 RepID=A0ABQ3S6G0_9ACTN|nr:hypothetical protein [Streptomyces asoensis]GGQ78795.1 hypothetical protein GCM10010496_47940 [Streptomyces asoensis]GHI63717.1 hypothetical protein Saso_53670 [Streptomyces asoensis]
MLWIAVLLLPLLSVLLVVMDRVEERLLAPGRAKRRHAATGRHLRLVRDTGPAPVAVDEAPPARPRAA